MKWSCQTKSDEGVTERTPLVVFALPRTGSNLFFNMMEETGRASKYEVLDLIPLYELFGKDTETQASGISRISSVMMNECEATDKQRIQATYLHRFEDPQGLLQFLTQIPSRSRNPYFTFKVFDFQLHRLQMTLPTFVDSMSKLRGNKKTKYIVLWRRRVIESYVSHTIAMKTGAWLKRVTAEENAIVIQKEGLEEFIEDNHRYYRAVREALDASNADYQVFEYDRDLSEEQRQLQTMKRIAGILGLSDEDVDVNSVHKKLSLVKQAQVPLEKQVKNWQEVVDWGYGGEVDEWVDLFDQGNS